MAAGTKATIAGLKADARGYQPAGTVDLGQPDPGAGSRRRAQVHQQLWVETVTNPAVPYPRADAPLQGEDVEELKYALAARSLIEGVSFLLTEVHSPEQQAASDLQDIARELGIVAASRTGKDDGGLLRVNEGLFVAVVVECLRLIERIR